MNYALAHVDDNWIFGVEDDAYIIESPLVIGELLHVEYSIPAEIAQEVQDTIISDLRLDGFIF